LSVDPIISNPASSQSINPYSYIGNNPLSGVDPTGYKTEEIGGPASGCAEFSRCDVTFFNLPESKYTRINVVDNGGKLVSSELYLKKSTQPLSDTLGPASTAQTPAANNSHAAAATLEQRFPVAARLALLSTLTDGAGHVLNAWDDGDVGIYQMGPSSTRKIGESLRPDSYLDDPDEHGERRPRGNVFVGISMEQSIITAASQAMEMNPVKVMKESGHGGTLDIKTGRPGHGPCDGFLFEGRYVTLREGGDILAGFNGKSHGLSLDLTSRLTGAYQAGRLQLGLTLATLGRVTWGPPPYYGETPYAGRSIVYGYGLRLLPMPSPSVAAYGPFEASPFLGIRGSR
jgi:hypothetical protein